MIVEFQVPTMVRLGSGVLAEVGEQARVHGDRALLVTGRASMRRSGTLDRVLGLCQEAGVEVAVCEHIGTNPRSDEVDHVADIGRAFGCSVIVGLGGGSAIDAAKAASVAFFQGPVGPLVGTSLPASARALPVVAVPTTAGSGAEVTKGAIVTDVARRLRSGIRGPQLYPRVALVDPDLNASTPLPVSVETLFDAFTHGVEALVARKASPLTVPMSLRTIELAAQNLPRVATGSSTASTRYDAAVAGLLGGINVATASTCLPHRLQHGMGAVAGKDLSHGRGLAALYPSWLRHAYPHAREEFDLIGDLMGGPDVHTAVERLLVEAKLDAGLKGLGWFAADLEIALSGVTGNLDNDPIEGITPDLLRSIYLGAMSGTSKPRAGPDAARHSESST